MWATKCDDNQGWTSPGNFSAGHDYYVASHLCYIICIVIFAILKKKNNKKVVLSLILLNNNKLLLNI